MPNYSLVANTVFQNRSFDDLLRPLAMYTEEYNAVENAANELATNASIWEGMADEERDPVAYAQYKRYADDLRRQAVNLSNGLNRNSRRDLLNLKRRYAAEIVPIEQAFANRKAQADEQRKALLQDPTLLLSRRADATSLDAYLGNPELGYDAYSGALLTSQVGTAAQRLAKELRDYGNGKPLDNYTKTWLQQHGYTAAEVAQAINNPDSPRSSQILNTLVNNVISDSGIPQWGDYRTVNQAYDYARQGLWQAVGETNISTYEDYGAKLAAQEAMQKRVADYKAGQDQINSTKHAYIPPYALRSNRDIKESANRINMVNKFVEKGWLTVDEDGSYNLSGPGLRALRVGYEHKDDKTPRVVDIEGRFLPGMSMKDIPEQYSDQKEFMHLLDDLSNGSLFNDNGDFRLDMSNRAGTINKLIHTLDEGAYDIWHTTEYGWHPTPEQAKSLMRNVIAASGKSGLREVDFQVDKEGNGSFKDVKKLDFTAPEVEKMSVGDVRISGAGITIIGVLGDNSYRIHVPRGTGGEGLTDNLMLAADERTKCAMIINSIENKPENQITMQDLQDYNTARKRYDDLGDIMSQYTGALSVESQAQPQQITIQGR